MYRRRDGSVLVGVFLRLAFPPAGGFPRSFLSFELVREDGSDGGRDDMVVISISFCFCGSLNRLFTVVRREKSPMKSHAFIESKAR